MQCAVVHAVDPGNWATDLAAGSAYGYDLLAAILLANICAIFFQVRDPPCAEAALRCLPSNCRWVPAVC
jgi:manganese transport protein